MTGRDNSMTDRVDPPTTRSVHFSTLLHNFIVSREMTSGASRLFLKMGRTMCVIRDGSLPPLTTRHGSGVLDNPKMQEETQILLPVT